MVGVLFVMHTVHSWGRFLVAGVALGRAWDVGLSMRHTPRHHTSQMTHWSDCPTCPSKQHDTERESYETESFVQMTSIAVDF